PCHDQVAARWWQAPDEQLEGRRFHHAGRPVAAGHRQLVEVGGKAGVHTRWPTLWAVAVRRSICNTVVGVWRPVFRLRSRELSGRVAGPPYPGEGGHPDPGGKREANVRPERWLDLLDMLFAGAWNPALGRFRLPYAFRGHARATEDL